MKFNIFSHKTRDKFISVIVLTMLMFSTNPNKRDYFDYATWEYRATMKAEICNKLDETNSAGCASIFFFLSGADSIKQLIADSTTRYNYLLFSFYTTNLPTYPLNKSTKHLVIKAFGLLKNYITVQINLK